MLAWAVLIAPGRWWSCSYILMLAEAVVVAPCNGGTVPVFYASRDYSVAPGRWWRCPCILMLVGAVLVAPVRWWNCSCILMIAMALLAAPGRRWSCSVS